MAVFEFLVLSLLDCRLMMSSWPVWSNREIPGVRVEREQDILRQSSDELEWILVEEPPRDVPVPLVVTSSSRIAGSDFAQRGALVMAHWQVDGHAFLRELTLPVQWPASVALGDQSLIIDLGTAIAPIEVETRVFQAVDVNGLPSPAASAIWRRYLDSTAECRITRETERDTWRIALDLPNELGTYYVSLRGSWGFPSDSDLIGATEWPMFDAAWIFTVVTG